MKRKAFRLTALVCACLMLACSGSFAVSRDVPESPYDSATVNGIYMVARSYLSKSCASSELSSSGSVSVMSSTTWFEYSRSDGLLRNSYNTTTDYGTTQLWCSAYPLSGDTVQYAVLSRGTQNFGIWETVTCVLG